MLFSHKIKLNIWDDLWLTALFLTIQLSQISELTKMFVSASAEGTNVASLKQFHVASPSRGPGFQSFHLRIKLRWSLKAQCSVNERTWPTTRKFLVLLKTKSCGLPCYIKKLQEWTSGKASQINYWLIRIKNIKAYVVSKRCDFWGSFLIESLL